MRSGGNPGAEAAGRSSALRAVFRMGIRIMVSAALLTWMLTRLDWPALWVSLRESQPVYLLLAFGVVPGVVLVSAWKWMLLVLPQEAANRRRTGMNYGYFLRLYYVGLFFNHFLPGSVGGDVVRIALLRKTAGWTLAAVSVFVERLTSGLALVIIVLAGGWMLEAVRPFLEIVLLLAGCLMLVVLLLWRLARDSNRETSQKLDGGGAAAPSGGRAGAGIRKRLRQGWQDALSVFRRYRAQKPGWWVQIALCSFAFQAGLVWINDLLFRAMGYRLPWLELLVFISLISALTMLPISVNGLGVREVSYLYFFQQLGVPQEIAVSVSLLFFLMVALSSLPGGLFWLKAEGRQRHETLEST